MLHTLNPWKQVTPEPLTFQSNLMPKTLGLISPHVHLHACVYVCKLVQGFVIGWCMSLVGLF